MNTSQWEACWAWEYLQSLLAWDQTVSLMKINVALLCIQHLSLLGMTVLGRITRQATYLAHIRVLVYFIVRYCQMISESTSL